MPRINLLYTACIILAVASIAPTVFSFSPTQTHTYTYTTYGCATTALRSRVATMQSEGWSSGRAAKKLIVSTVAALSFISSRSLKILLPNICCTIALYTTIPLTQVIQVFRLAQKELTDQIYFQQSRHPLLTLPTFSRKDRSEN
jgi:hypothetical protein